MVSLRGKGSATNVNLLMVAFDKSVSKDGKTHFPNFQVDARDERVAGQSSFHLHAVRDSKSKSGYNNDVPIAASQFDLIKDAAGPNTQPYLNNDGEQIGTVYGFKASLMQANDGKGYIPVVSKDPETKKPLSQSDFKVDKDTLDNQYKAMSANSKAIKEAKAAEAEATKESEASTPAPAEQEPAVG